MAQYEIGLKQTALSVELPPGGDINVDVTALSYIVEAPTEIQPVEWVCDADVSVAIQGMERPSTPAVFDRNFFSYPCDTLLYSDKVTAAVSSISLQNLSVAETIAALAGVAKSETVNCTEIRMQQFDARIAITDMATSAENIQASVARYAAELTAVIEAIAASVQSDLLESAVAAETLKAAYALSANDQAVTNELVFAAVSKPASAEIANLFEVAVANVAPVLAESCVMLEVQSAQVGRLLSEIVIGGETTSAIFVANRAVYEVASIAETIAMSFASAYSDTAVATETQAKSAGSRVVESVICAEVVNSVWGASAASIDYSSVIEFLRISAASQLTEQVAVSEVLSTLLNITRALTDTSVCVEKVSVNAASITTDVPSCLDTQYAHLSAPSSNTVASTEAVRAILANFADASYFAENYVSTFLTIM